MVMMVIQIQRSSNSINLWVGGEYNTQTGSWGWSQVKNLGEMI